MEIAGFGADREACEAELEQHGILLPLVQRASWLAEQPNTATTLIVVRAASGVPLTATSITRQSARVLPGHWRSRVERFGGSLNESADATLLRSLAARARNASRCLRLTVEVFQRDAGRRLRLGTVLAECGFVRAELSKSYAKTLALELTDDEGALFAGIHSKARRDVRYAHKAGFEVAPVTDVSLAPRLHQLSSETFSRTGGPTPARPWAGIIRLSAREPGHSRISGLFDPRASGPDRLVAFAWGCHHGHYVTYEAGAASRARHLHNAPLSYAPLWDLIAWARRSGASWFDFGGITSGTRETPSDPVGGISDFKRYFSKHVVDVGEDWVMEPHPLRATIVRAASTVARWTGI